MCSGVPPTKKGKANIPHRLLSVTSTARLFRTKHTRSPPPSLPTIVKEYEREVDEEEEKKKKKKKGGRAVKFDVSK